MQQASAQGAVQNGKRADAIAPINVREKGHGKPNGKVQPDKNVIPAGGVSAVAEVQQGADLLAFTNQTVDRNSKVTALIRELEQIEPALAYDPRVRFPLAVANRQQGLPRNGEKFYLALKHNRPADAWRACAEAELWLAEQKVQSPKPVWYCTHTPNKPRLDGQLEEAFWRSGNVVELKSPQREDADWGSSAMLAYDDEFLYLAVRCTKVASGNYSTSDAPRPRDADLSDHDRVELLLDIDRDFATYYRLTIDHRGWTAENCWHDVTWNPDWFVAAGGDDTSWTVEAAIPLAQLTGQPPVAKSTWSVGMQRIVPGTGFQSWNTPAEPEVIPEGFGYLMFQP